MIHVKLAQRKSDKAGEGHFGASRDRGNRVHYAIDFDCSRGAEVISPIRGKVTKLGYPYEDDLSYRYVQITDKEGRNHRFFYVEPTVEVDDKVDLKTVLGVCQDINARYSKASNHIHYEIKIGPGKNAEDYLNPEEVLG